MYKKQEYTLRGIQTIVVLDILSNYYEFLSKFQCVIDFYKIEAKPNFVL